MRSHLSDCFRTERVKLFPNIEGRLRSKIVVNEEFSLSISLFCYCKLPACASSHMVNVKVVRAGITNLVLDFVT